MIKLVTGDLFAYAADPVNKVDAIGQGVNCLGKMGAGIAKAFRENYSQMYYNYVNVCSVGGLQAGQVFVWDGPDHTVFNVASQLFPGPCAKLSYLKMGLEYVRFYMEEFNLSHLAIPRIGAGIGGLDFEDVHAVVEEVFLLSNVDVTVVSLP